MASGTASAAFRSLARSRRSCRRFAPDRPVPSEALKDALLTTRASPSGFNLQPTHMLLVRDPTVKRRLADEAMLGMGNVYRTRDCSAVAVFLSDLQVTRRIARIAELERESGARDPNYLAVLPVAASFLTGEGGAATFLKKVATDALSPVKPMPSVEPVEAWSYKNAGLAAMQYTLACTSHGLATCMMEGYDARRAKEILRVPDRYGVPVMVATGYDYDGEDAEGVGGAIRTPRLDMEELFFGDSFGEGLDLLGGDEHLGGEEDEG